MGTTETKLWSCGGRGPQQHLGHWGRLGTAVVETSTSGKPGAWGQKRRKCLLCEQNCSNGIQNETYFVLSGLNFHYPK